MLQPCCRPGAPSAWMLHFLRYKKVLLLWEVLTQFSENYKMIKLLDWQTVSFNAKVAHTEKQCQNIRLTICSKYLKIDKFLLIVTSKQNSSSGTGCMVTKLFSRQHFCNFKLHFPGTAIISPGAHMGDIMLSTKESSRFCRSCPVGL